MKFSVGLTMFPQAIVEGKVIFRESLNVREVFKHFFSQSLSEKALLEVLCLGIDMVEVGYRGRTGALM